MPNHRWLEFLRYLEFFLGGEGENEVYRTTIDRMKAMEENLQIPSHPFHEFIYRLNLFSDTHTPRQFYYKLAQFARNGLTYLKKHPSLISTDLKEIIEKHPARMGWCLGQYKTETMPNGTEVVQRDNQIVDGFKKSSAALPSIQTKMMTNLFTVADLYERIAGSIKDTDIKKMTVGDKLKALGNLAFIFQAASKKGPTNHFTQINLGGDVRELEKQSLAFVKKKLDD
jgi:hypothetical protein